MTTTRHYNIPLPDRGDGDWIEVLREALSHVDTILYDRQVALSEAIGVVGTAEDELSPFTMMMSGYDWPSGARRFGSYTLQSLLDGWMQAVHAWIKAEPHWPVLYPEGAYCDTKAAVRGSSATMVYGPIVRLKNSTSRQAFPHAPVFLANDGGMVPSEPMVNHFPLIIPRVAVFSHLQRLIGEYTTNIANQDMVVDSDGEITSPSGLDAPSGGTQSLYSNMAYAPGTYRGAYFDHDNFTAGVALRLVGMGQGVVRVYGLAGDNEFVYEEVVIDGLNFDATTIRADWIKILGVSFKGTDLAYGVSEVNALQGMVNFKLYSDGSVYPIGIFQAWRPAAKILDRDGKDTPYGDYGTEGVSSLNLDITKYGIAPEVEGSEDDYIDYDIWQNPEPRFRVAWESIDPGWLWDTSFHVEGIPMIMYAMGLCDNRISFLYEAMRDNLDEADVHDFINEMMTTHLLPIPTSPQPMYVVGYDKDGNDQVWTCTPKLVFTTVDLFSVDSSYYDWPDDWSDFSDWWGAGLLTYGVSAASFMDGLGLDSMFDVDLSDPSSIGDMLADFVNPIAQILSNPLPWDGIFPPPPGVAAHPIYPGTFLLYRYQFPTDLAKITNIMWGNLDEPMQYSKVLGSAVPIPIGRALADTPGGQPGPVKLFYSSGADDAAKSSALVDMVIGFLEGNLTGTRLQAQVEAVVREFGIDATTLHVLLWSLPKFYSLILDVLGGLIYLYWTGAYANLGNPGALWDIIKVFLTGAGFTHLVRMLFSTKSLILLFVIGIVLYGLFTTWQDYGDDDSTSVWSQIMALFAGSGLDDLAGMFTSD